MARVAAPLACWLATGLTGFSGAQPAYFHDDCWLRIHSGYAVTSYTGTNPAPAQLQEEMRVLAAEYDIPLEIMGGIVQQESSAYQYGSDGFVVHNLFECRNIFSGVYSTNSAPPGLGLMQLTGATARAYPLPPLIEDWRNNLRQGVDVLHGKYVRFYRDYPASLKNLMIANRHILENWYYGTLGYNGFIAGSTYPNSVYSRVLSPSSRISGLFRPVNITRPANVIPGWQVTSTTSYTFYAVTPDGVWHTPTGDHSGTIHFAAPYRSSAQMLTYLLGQQPTPSLLRQVDYNRDGRFNAADLVAAINYENGA